VATTKILKLTIILSALLISLDAFSTHVIAQNQDKPTESDIAIRREL
jgi:hypothetical protein